MPQAFRVAPLMVLLTCVVLGGACRRKETFPTIGTKVASPVDVEVSADDQYFYVLNADFDRTYNRGSVLVLDKEGEKVGAVEVPRMGRALSVSGNDMLAAIDAQDEKHKGLLILFDVSDPRQPKEIKRFDLTCSPIGLEMRKGFDYFAMTCTDGSFWLGHLEADRAETWFKLVRKYGVVRRALYLDPARNMVLGFPTDLDSQSTSNDYLATDVATYDGDGVLQQKTLPDGSKINVPDEIPDDRQDNPRENANRSLWRSHQFFVYDITAEAAAGFPERKSSDVEVYREQRWVHFKLRNFDGAPDPNAGADDPNLKYYRTNFWAARPDPMDPDVFYLSHRGVPRESGSPHAGQVVRVRITGDLHTRPDGTFPMTEDVMEFDRVYGFGSEISKYHYPGDFEVVDVAGQNLLVVNHFRDLVNWSRKETYFSLATKVIDENTWFDETEKKDKPDEKEPNPSTSSWYQVALSHEGRVASCLFYANAVKLLDVKPGVGITPVKTIQ